MNSGNMWPFSSGPLHFHVHFTAWLDSSVTVLIHPGWVCPVCGCASFCSDSPPQLDIQLVSAVMAPVRHASMNIYAHILLEHLFSVLWGTYIPRSGLHLLLYLECEGPPNFPTMATPFWSQQQYTRTLVLRRSCQHWLSFCGPRSSHSHRDDAVHLAFSQ